MSKYGHAVREWGGCGESLKMVMGVREEVRDVLGVGRPEKWR